MKIAYLGGPILGCTDAECMDWRAEAVAKLQCSTLDPLRRDYRGKEDAHVREIVEDDKSDIDQCDYLLMFCPKPSAGTSMEIIYGWEKGKRVWVVVPEGIAISPWVRYHATEGVFRSMREAFDSINVAIATNLPARTGYERAEIFQKGFEAGRDATILKARTALLNLGQQPS
jgi:nucleoside 2-deoxyribosyltransferase